jgi:hypothetical protein
VTGSTCIARRQQYFGNTQEGNDSYTLTSLTAGVIPGMIHDLAAKLGKQVKAIDVIPWDTRKNILTLLSRKLLLFRH